MADEEPTDKDNTNNEPIKFQPVAAETIEEQDAQVQTIEQEVRELAMAIQPYGVNLADVLEPTQIRLRVEAFCACRILVLKGICTEREMHLEQISAQRDILRQVLLMVEQMQLQQKAQESKPVVAKRGEIIKLH